MPRCLQGWSVDACHNEMHVIHGATFAKEKSPPNQTACRRRKSEIRISKSETNSKCLNCGIQKMLPRGLVPKLQLRHALGSEALLRRRGCLRVGLLHFPSLLSFRICFGFRVSDFEYSPIPTSDSLKCSSLGRGWLPSNGAAPAHRFRNSR